MILSSFLLPEPFISFPLGYIWNKTIDIIMGLDPKFRDRKDLLQGIFPLKLGPHRLSTFEL